MPPELARAKHPKGAGPKNTEIELKYGLNKRQYDRLRSLLKHQQKKVSKQLNIYFDDRRRSLQRKGSALRIRIANGKSAHLTVKFRKLVQRSAPKGLKVRAEYEVRIPVPKAKALMGGKAKILDLRCHPMRRLRRRLGKSSDISLGPIGKIRTTRHKFRWHNGLVLELDHFTIGHRHYYELEVETAHPIRTDRKIRQFFKENALPVRPELQSKLARLLKVLDKQKG